MWFHCEPVCMGQITIYYVNNNKSTKLRFSNEFWCIKCLIFLTSVDCTRVMTNSVVHTCPILPTECGLSMNERIFFVCAYKNVIMD